MPLVQHSRDDRQAVQAEVEKLLGEYLDARNEFERVFQMALEGNLPSEAVNTVTWGNYKFKKKAREDKHEFAKNIGGIAPGT